MELAVTSWADILSQKKQAYGCVQSTSLNIDRCDEPVGCLAKFENNEYCNSGSDHSGVGIQHTECAVLLSTRMSARSSKRHAPEEDVEAICFMLGI